MSPVDEPEIESDLEDKQSIERLQRSRNLRYMTPFEFWNEFREFFALWFRTRNWKAISVIIPPLLLLFTLGGLVLAGRMRSKESLRKWYQEQAVLTTKGIVETRERGEKPTQEQLSKADLLLKRILQLGEESAESRFFVAQQNLQLGRIDVARRMIERLAPRDAKGYSIAHEWLAADLVARGTKGEPVSQEVIEHHCKHSLENLDETYDPKLYVLYASMLDRKGRTSDAAQMLTRAGEIDPKLQLAVVEYFLQRNLPNQAKGAADLAVDRLTESMKSKNRTAEERATDIVLLARAYQLTGRIDESVKVLESSPAVAENANDWSRTMSDNYRLKFRQSLIRTEGQVQVNLNFLNAAIAYDPTNVAVQSELGILREMGIAATPERRSALVKLIAAEGNSIVPKLALAEESIAQGNTVGAISYYELVLAEVPNCTLVLNNLAILMTKKTPPDFERANSLINQAIQLSPTVAEFRDSKGDIESEQGNNEESIKQYLATLEMMPVRKATREKLIARYETAQNSEEANRHREILNRVQAELDRIQNEQIKQREAATQAVPSEPVPSDPTRETKPSEVSGQPAIPTQPAEPMPAASSNPAAEPAPAPDETSIKKPSSPGSN